MQRASAGGILGSPSPKSRAPRRAASKPISTSAPIADPLPFCTPLISRPSPSCNHGIADKPILVSSPLQNAVDLQTRFVLTPIARTKQKQKLYTGSEHPLTP